MEWQPIETAPKDGSYVLLYLKCTATTYEYGLFTVARFAYEAIDNCWETCGDDADDYYSIGIPGEPTHWMPLPNPPKE